jgi:hypothetical protein
VRDGADAEIAFAFVLPALPLGPDETELVAVFGLFERRVVNDVFFTGELYAGDKEEGRQYEYKHGFAHDCNLPNLELI